MKLYSTLDKRIVEIVPIKENNISIYTCGPTVYNRVHIGNIRAFINWDIMHRAYMYLGYDVKRIMNFTDVGHMTSVDDFGSDFGEDKMDRQAEREGIQPIDIANKYIDTVLDDFRDLNILAPNGETIPEDLTYEKVSEYGWTRATDYVDEMIEIIKRIEANGYTYETEQALYFDVTKIPDYTIFTGQNLDEKEIGSREDVSVDLDKKHPADFVLWMKRVGKYQNHIMNWNSPWGNGFPGWHIECTAMGTSVLGEHFDIHTGGVDLMPVHHTNERAQNIGAFGHPVVKYWVHNEWVLDNKGEEKLSKSRGASSLPEIKELGFSPMDLRYLFISTNYHTKAKFSLEALEGARNSRVSLEKKIRELGENKGNVIQSFRDRFKKNLEDNLNISGTLALINELLKSDESKEDILATLLDFDKVLGLNLNDVLEKKETDMVGEIGEELENLLQRRKVAKENKDYVESDRLRDEISKLGFKVIDTPDSQSIKKNY